jgi:hypothetical protein
MVGEVTAELILSLGTGLGRELTFTLWQLRSQRKITLYLLDKRLGGFQSQFGHSGEVKNLLCLLAIEHQFLGHPAQSPSLILSSPSSKTLLYAVKI